MLIQHWELPVSFLFPLLQSKFLYPYCRKVNFPLTLTGFPHLALGQNCWLPLILEKLQYMPEMQGCWGSENPFSLAMCCGRVLLNPCQAFLTPGSTRWTSGCVPNSQWRCSVATWAKGAVAYSTRPRPALWSVKSVQAFWISRVFFSKDLTKQLQNPEPFVPWSRSGGGREEIYMQPVDEINFLIANRFVNGSSCFACLQYSVNEVVAFIGLYSTNKVF